jgi:3',5'-cyclic AMP phosphodiesterase CpdA
VTHFRTAAPPQQSSFRFAVLGDTREGTTKHQAIVKHILEAEPDFVIHTGDMVEIGNCTACWDDFFSIEARLLASAPFYPTLGNHEQPLSPSGETQYFDIFHLPGNESWYAFDYGDARFISLKADGYPMDVYYPDQEQLDWLEEQLASNTRSWAFVYLHWGVFTSRGEDFLEIGMRERLVPLFERYGVNAVFMGHNHGYERIEVNGITYITSAGGGASLYEMAAPEPGSQAVAKKFHFVLLDMNGDHLTGQVFDYRGNLIDHFDLALKR